MRRTAFSGRLRGGSWSVRTSRRAQQDTGFAQETAGAEPPGHSLWLSPAGSRVLPVSTVRVLKTSQNWGAGCCPGIEHPTPIAVVGCPTNGSTQAYALTLKPTNRTTNRPTRTARARRIDDLTYAKAYALRRGRVNLRGRPFLPSPRLTAPPTPNRSCVARPWSRRYRAGTARWRPSLWRR